MTKKIENLKTVTNLNVCLFDEHLLCNIRWRWWWSYMIFFFWYIKFLFLQGNILSWNKILPLKMRRREQNFFIIDNESMDDFINDTKIYNRRIFIAYSMNFHSFSFLNYEWIFSLLFCGCKGLSYLIVIILLAPFLLPLFINVNCRFMIFINCTF